MRFLASLFFILSIPIVVCLATIQFGGISEISVKKALAASGGYDFASKQISSQLSLPQGDAATGAIFKILNNRITGNYFQEKVETLVDDSFAYIKGERKEEPVLSFSEIKDDITAKNPQLLNSLTDIMTEMKKQQAQMPETSDEMAGTSNQKEEEASKSIETFIQNDFKISYGKQLQGLKTAYTVIRIAFPVLILLDILYLFILFFLSNTKRQKCAWLGTTLLIAGIYAYLYVFAGTFIIDVVLQALKTQQSPYVGILTPIITGLTVDFLAQFKSFTTIVSIGGILIGAVLIVLSFVFKSSITPAPKKVIPKKK